MNPQLTDPRWLDVDCPDCDRPMVRTTDEEGRRCYECRNVNCQAQEGEDE